MSVLLDMPIPLPPLDEQRRIVALLDRAAEIRRRADAARAKARAIIPALFLDMFGDPATNPKGWPHLPFGQITNEFRYGTNQKCNDEAGEGSVPVLRIPNVIGGQIDWSDIKHAALPAKEREKTRLRVGDLLFVRTNGNPDYIGRCAYFDAQTDASYASYLIRARLAESMSPIFAIHHFNHPRFRPLMLRMGKTTAGNYNLSVEGLSALPVMVPPLARQAAFAETAQRLEATARALDAAAAKAEVMAAALSAEVFDAGQQKRVAIADGSLASC
jgi:type I restriction enzyme S subunit